MACANRVSCCSLGSGLMAGGGGRLFRSGRNASQCWVAEPDYFKKYPRRVSQRPTCKAALSDQDESRLPKASRNSSMESLRSVDALEEIDCVGTGTDVECVIRDSETDFKSANSSSEGKVSGNSSMESLRSVDALEEIDCVGTGTDVECVIRDSETDFKSATSTQSSSEGKVYVEVKHSGIDFLQSTFDTVLLVSPFFFWGTSMVAMKGVLPKAGPFFVASTRLVPAGLLLVGFAALRGRKQPRGLQSWLAIAIFGLIDASCFQGFLAEGLGRTSAGLGSVIIDSQPLTVAVLAALLFDEKIGPLGVLGLFLGVAGLLLLEVPVDTLLSVDGFQAIFQSLSSNELRLWDSGEWDMLLAAQSMAIGTLLVRWVCKYSDPVMATGWHMVIGGLPLLVLSAVHNEPVLNGGFSDLELADWSSLAYTSVFGSAVSYGVFFYNATKGSLTKLSSLTFLTPMFAAFFGYLFLGETLTPPQIVGASITLAAIYFVNTRSR